MKNIEKRQQSAQINFKNWILDTTKCRQLPYPRNYVSPHPTSLGIKILSHRSLFKFQLTPESQGAAFYV